MALAKEHQPDSHSPSDPSPVPDLSDVLLQIGVLLFENGQTTQQIIRALVRIGERMGFRTTVLVRWGDLSLSLKSETGTRYALIPTMPAGVDMHRVVATMTVVEDLLSSRLDLVSARDALDRIARAVPVSTSRFSLAAAAGAAALGVIFGDTSWASLLLIVMSAGLGACLRRWLAKRTSSFFVQPFCASLVAGLIGAIAVHLHLSAMQRLVAVCPCMVLVPGPHVLNGAIDLVRGRLPLGASRLLFASLIILVICAGLLLGLSFGGVSLPVFGASTSVPIGYDICAAGIAVAAYGTFFSMPWRMLPAPVAIGMVAHAFRWMAITLAGTSVETGAFVACLIVGIAVTLITERLKLPFAAFAFASVVSMIPGVLLFRMAGGLVALATAGGAASSQLLSASVANGITAILIIIAMTSGLILPRLLIGHFRSRIFQSE